MPSRGAFVAWDALKATTGAALVVAAPATTSAAPVVAFKASHATKAPLLGIARAGTRLVAVGDYGVVILSDDDGATWRQATSTATRHTLTAVTFTDERHGWAVGHGGTVLASNDGGETWTPAYAGPGDAALLSVWFDSAGHGLVVG